MGIEFFDTKAFYAMYLRSLKPNLSDEEIIDKIESAIKQYRPDDQISNARRMINYGFKEKLNEIVGIK
jgi:hypothetical protein